MKITFFHKPVPSDILEKNNLNAKPKMIVSIFNICKKKTRLFLSHNAKYGQKQTRFLFFVLAFILNIFPFSKNDQTKEESLLKPIFITHDSDLLGKQAISLLLSLHTYHLSYTFFVHSTILTFLVILEAIWIQKC